MKSLSFLLIPSVVLLVSACGGPPAPGPGAAVYGGPAYGYGPGPNPQAGYYWNGTVYVQGRAPWYHNNNYYNRSVTDVNDVNVNRTVVNDRTVNNTNVNNTRVNDRTVNRANVNETNVKERNRRVTNAANSTHKREQGDEKRRDQNVPNQ